MSKDQFPAELPGAADGERPGLISKAERFEDEPRFSLVEVVSVLFRHWKQIAVVFSVIFGGACIYSFAMVQDTYTSKADILVRGVRGGLTVDPSSSSGVSGEFMPTFGERAQNELAILESEALAEAVVDELGADVVIDVSDNHQVLAASRDDVVNDPTLAGDPRRQAIAKVMSGFTTKRNPGQVIRLTYTSSTPEAAHNVLGTLTKKYLDRHLEIHESAASPEFFAVEAERIRELIDTKEAELESFLGDAKLADVAAEKDAAFVRQSETERQLRALRVDRSATEARILSIQESLQSREREVEVKRNTVVNEEARRLNHMLLDLQLQEAQLAVKYFDDNPELKTVREQIALLKDRLTGQPDNDTEITTAVDKTSEYFEQKLIEETTSLKGIIASEASLTAEQVGIEEEVQFLSQVAPEGTRLQRELAALRDSYENFQESEQRAIIQTSLDRNKTTNVAVVQPATFPDKKDDAQRMRNVMLGVFGGLFAGVLLAFAREYLDDSMKTSSDVERRLELPVLATVAYDRRM